jgi:hypothetical protein
MPTIPLHHLLLLIIGGIAVFLCVAAILVQLACAWMGADAPHFARALIATMAGVGIVFLTNGVILAVAANFLGLENPGPGEPDPAPNLRIVVSSVQFVADALVFGAVFALSFEKVGVRRGLVAGLIVAVLLLATVVGGRAALAPFLSRPADMSETKIRGEPLSRYNFPESAANSRHPSMARVVTPSMSTTSPAARPTEPRTSVTMWASRSATFIPSAGGTSWHTSKRAE